MTKYKVVYEYLTQGVATVEANSIEDAKENAYLADDYGEQEIIRYNKILKVEKVK